MRRFKSTCAGDLRKSYGLHDLSTAFSERLLRCEVEVFSQSLIIERDYKPTLTTTKSSDEEKLIKDAMKNSVLDLFLNEDEMNELIPMFQSVKMQDEEVIVEENKTGDLYVVQSGKVRFELEGETPTWGDEGTIFGELSLIHDNIVEGDRCVAEGACTLWKLDRITYGKVIGARHLKEDDDIKNDLKEVPMIQKCNFDEENLVLVSNCFSREVFEKGDVILKMGDPDAGFIIVKEGQCILSHLNDYCANVMNRDQFLNKNQSHGHHYLLGYTDAVETDVIANTDQVVVLKMSKSNFQKLIGPLHKNFKQATDSYLKMIFANISYIQRNPLLKSKSDELYEVMETLKLEEGEEIDAHYESAFFLVINGRLEQKNLDTGDVITIGLHENNGDDGVFRPPNKPAPRLVYTAKESGTKIKVLTLKDIRGVFRQVSKAMGPSVKHMDIKLDNTIMHNNLKKHRILGAGAFSKVWLVEDTRNGKAYALKVQCKRRSLRNAVGIIREKEIMSLICNEFIVRMVNSYQDKYHLYFVLNLIQGGELYTLIHSSDKDPGIPEGRAKFYAAGILEGLKYLHIRKIIYRDLKPDNVMIGTDGYPVLVDLGAAKITTEKTFTICGTVYFLAPEVISRKGHNKEADIWSFGVVLYEMIHGHNPFFDKDYNQIEIFKKIYQVKYEFPSKGMSPTVKNLISKILVQNPSERIGSYSNNRTDIYHHQWFKGLPWAAYRKKKFDAPWKPKVKNALDAQYFEEWSHLEAEEKPKSLTEEEQDVFKDF